MNWYVQVNNQAYGPYADVQMQSFVAEGRVTGNSLISNAPNQGFFAAQGYDVFALWSQAQQSLAVGGEQQGGNMANYQTAPNPQTQYTQIHNEAQQYSNAESNYNQTAQQSVETITPEPQAQSSVYLVMAEIRSEGAMDFLKSLQNFGVAQRIGDTVWLLRSSHSVEKVRNTLSQSLNRQDRLFILDATHNKTAWFNIGADLDHRIRELWNEDED